MVSITWSQQRHAPQDAKNSQASTLGGRSQYDDDHSYTKATMRAGQTVDVRAMARTGLHEIMSAGVTDRGQPLGFGNAGKTR